MIDLQHISKTYPLRNGKFYALRDVTLHVNPGEFLAIHGASGAGKSTLLNIIGCMDDFSDGRYLLEGADAGNMPDHKKSAIRNQKIGFVLQDFALVNDQTVLYNVMLPLLFGNTPFRLIRKKAAAALERVGLSQQASQRVHLLSGGEKQRVAIARAIVTDPVLLLADEPTGQLDSKTGEQIMELLCNLHEKGITILMVTHNADIAAYADRILTVKDGVLIDPMGDYLSSKE